MPPRRTALHQLHAGLGARFTEFGGWDMPVRYGSIVEEHHAVRRAAGLFDLSHMGELRVSGPGAAAGLAWALASHPGRLAIGRAGYSLLCTPGGGIIDDLIVYRMAEHDFLVVPNASNREVVAAELGERLAGHDAAVDDETLATSLLAVQGPAAAAILAGLTDLDLGRLSGYAAAETRVAGMPALVARTGYTGEDGFELFVAWADGPLLWEALLAAGAEGGLVACGLGARDTLRLEAGMPLYGNELGRDTTPYEAGLGRVVKLDKPGDFVGRAALAAAAAAPRRSLVGLELLDRGIARHGYPVHLPGEVAACGEVTSGTQSPTLGVAIAMAYVPPDRAEVGTMVDVGIRASRVPARVVPLPFYRRQA
ncbi:MAG TPA: glycine cleavage system aminomethyltransferase GcvT [Anaerolineae bacterium]|nr:glycine cleavage system aminomethyltransferase GcvT [Anaerolineae bacterium]